MSSTFSSRDFTGVAGAVDTKEGGEGLRELEREFGFHSFDEDSRGDEIRKSVLEPETR